MTLQQKLQAFQHEFTQQTPATVLEVLSRNTSLQQQNNLKGKALNCGDDFPQFNLPDSYGINQSLDLYLSKGPLIISFYRGGWCPYCVIELKAQCEIVSSLPELNASLVAITPEHHSHTSATKASNQLSFSVLSDTHNLLAHQCGLAYSINDELKAQYANFGVDIADRHKNDKFELPIPATYIVDEQRVIRYAFVEEDYISRAEPQALLEVLSQLKQ